MRFRFAPSLRRALVRAAVHAATSCALALPTAHAVSLNEDGTGEALLYPYYTVRSSNGNPFNTFVSIVNHTSDAKALRVRFREGRNAREVAGFNLFLSRNDVWAAAVVPTATGARLISADRSCVSPALTAAAGELPGVTFYSAQYLGDGKGDESDRVREGWIEVLEMAVLTGASAAAVTHDASATPTPANCAAVEGSAVVQTAAPTGGLSGTLTIINVASGLDFTIGATALSDLASGPYYRAANDPYPGLGAAEIRPVSVVSANGVIYRSTWNRGADAVSAVLMRSSWLAEFILDANTRSTTDLVVTFPTRQFYVSDGNVAAPFTASCAFSRNDTFAGEPIEMFKFGREEFGGAIIPISPHPPAPNFRCGGTTTVVDFHNTSAHTNFTPETHVFGSTNRALPVAGMVFAGNDPNGWVGFNVTGGRALVSLESSSRTNLATGTTIQGAHQFSGLPVVGFSARTFVNGTLTCASGSCQGNYGGAFPLRFRRSVAPAS